jgi:hypothetical protein
MSSADEEPIITTTVSSVEDTKIVRVATLKIVTEDDNELDILLGLDQVEDIDTNEYTAEGIDALLQSSTTNQLKNQIVSAIDESITNMDTQLGNSDGIAGGSIYTNIDGELKGSRLPTKKILVHSRLNTTVGKSIDTINSYRLSSSSSANSSANTRANTKAPTNISTAMDAYANVISEAIDFGSSYTYQTGLLSGFKTGLDRYAPDLNSVNATGTQTTVLSSDTVYFDKYARVYFVVTNSKKNRLISNDNYVIREGDYTMSDLVSSTTQAFYFTEDDVSVSVTSSNKYTISATVDKIIGSSLTFTTPQTEVLTAALTALTSSDIIYYSPNKRLYLVLKNGVYKRLFTSSGTALA